MRSSHVNRYRIETVVYLTVLNARNLPLLQKRKYGPFISESSILFSIGDQVARTSVYTSESGRAIYNESWTLYGKIPPCRHDQYYLDSIGGSASKHDQNVSRSDACFRPITLELCATWESKLGEIIFPSAARFRPRPPMTCAIWSSDLVEFVY